MSMVSHLHHLFNPDTCQASIHRLHWKDRPLQCPRCQSHHVGLWGASYYQPGLKHYRCKGKDCKRTFNDLTGTLMDGRGIRAKRDNGVSVMYAAGLNSAKSSATLQSTDRHGILGQKPADFQESL
jgi:transposase-like protein